MTDAGGVQPAAGEAAGAPAVDAQGWRRFHIATPLVKSWFAVLVGLGIVADGFIGFPFGGPFGGAPFGDGSFGDGSFDGSFGEVDPEDGGSDLPFSVGLSTQLLGVLVLAVLALAANILSWSFTRYRVHEGAVQLRSGVLSRSFRQAPLDRIQAVDVVQPIVGRLVGLAELRVEVAGGSASDVRLAYLTERHAQRLRNALLAEAAGVRVDDVDEAPEAPETPVLAVPVGRLVASVLVLASWTIVFVVVGLVVVVVAEAPVAALGVFPALLGFGGYLFSRFARAFNFRLATSPDGIRVRAGLTETRAATIPPGRVQALQLSQPWLWRPWDWWRVSINVAGYGAADDATQRTVLLPVGSRLDALWVLRLVVDDIGTGDPLTLLDAALTGSGQGGGFVTSPRRARWLDPLSWRRNGYAATRTVVLLRSGRLQRSLVVVPHERTQSLGLTRGPLERWARLVDVGLHSTPGPVAPRVPHLEPAEGARLVAEQAERARIARAADTSERWMARRQQAPPPPGQPSLPASEATDGSRDVGHDPGEDPGPRAPS